MNLRFYLICKVKKSRLQKNSGYKWPILYPNKRVKKRIKDAEEALAILKRYQAGTMMIEKIRIIILCNRLQILKGCLLRL